MHGAVTLIALTIFAMVGFVARFLACALPEMRDTFEAAETLDAGFVLVVVALFVVHSVGIIAMRIYKSLAEEWDRIDQ